MPEASANLIEIYGFIEKTSPQNAASMAAQLIDAIDSLDHFPHRFKVHSSKQSADRVVHSMPVPPFVIYYRIREAIRAVEVLTIRHGARGQPDRFL